MLIHDCEVGKKVLQEGEWRNPTPKSVWRHCYGAAISSQMFQTKGSKFAWVDNGEYASPIIYCPFCGIDLRPLITE